jgi:hypothetical protein
MGIEDQPLALKPSEGSSDAALLSKSNFRWSRQTNRTCGAGVGTAGIVGDSQEP